MTCPVCQVVFTPTKNQQYCTPTCADKAYQRRKREHINAVSRAWSRRNRKKRRQIYLRSQRKHAAATWQRNKWRHAASYSRRLSRKLLLKLRPAICEAAGVHRGRVECHHKDNDPFNRAPENLEWLCTLHHRAYRSHHYPAAGAPSVPARTTRRSLPHPGHLTDRTAG